MVTFLRIENKLPHLENKNDLTTGHNYLMDVCTAVSNRNYSLDLSSRNPEKIAHFRSLILANSVLRLYVATENSTKNLTTLTTYIMKDICACVVQY